MKDISPKKLAKALVEKHDKFIIEYSDVVDKARQISMLKEKRDQLVHWVQENQSKDKYAKELEDTKTELSKMLEDFDEKGKGYYKELEEKIDSHRTAKDYWSTKIGELTT